nr:MAG TPA: DNA repair protein MmcB-like protein [Caudoviricetes sp.]
MTEVSTKPLPMNAGLVEAAIRRHVDHRRNLLIPEAAVRFERPGQRGFDEYRADFMMVSDAGYGTELEVKVSIADWRRDLSKPKWVCMPSWISRFVYVVPIDLGIPTFVPTGAGVWHVVPTLTRQYSSDEVRPRADGYAIVVARAPHVNGRDKVPPAVISKWHKNLYYRYWDQRIHAEGRIARHVREGVA